MSKFVGFKSVVGRITMAFLVVLPILAYALGSATYDAITSHRDAGMIDRQNAAANNLIAGVYEILMERLATNNALLAEQPAGGDVLKEIDVRRSVAVKKIGAAFEDLSAQDFPAKAALLAELKGAIEKANGYRGKADAAVKQQKAARDADTVKNLFVALSELSTTSQKVWAAVLSNTSRLDPELARLSNIRILAWNLRDTAGFERSHIAAAISSKAAIPADKLTAISEIRAQLATMWKLLNISLREKELAGVTKGMQSAKDGYYAKFQPLADEMRKVSANGGGLSDVDAAMGRHHDAAAVHAARHHVRRRRSERSLYGEPAERRARQARPLDRAARARHRDRGRRHRLRVPHGRKADQRALRRGRRPDQDREGRFGAAPGARRRDRPHGTLAAGLPPGPLESGDVPARAAEGERAARASAASSSASSPPISSSASAGSSAR